MPADVEEVTVSFFVEGLPPSPNRTKGLHWSKLEKIKKEWMQHVRFKAQEVKAREHLRGVYDYARIDFCVSLGDNRRRDPDNIIFSICKPALDSLTGVLIKDDSIDNIELSFSFNREKPKGFRVTLTGN